MVARLYGYAADQLEEAKQHNIAVATCLGTAYNANEALELHEKWDPRTKTYPVQTWTINGGIVPTGKDQVVGMFNAQKLLGRPQLQSNLH